MNDKFRREHYYDDLWELIRDIDTHLDAAVSDDYKDAPLAQDWARICKVAEELGETIAELILYTGQNPRKQDQRPETADKVLDELADTALTAIYGMQHFTKDANVTLHLLRSKARFHRTRLLGR